MKNHEITINNNPIPIEKELGRGGTKTVYQVAIDGLKRALAIPNNTDSQEVKDRKWEIAKKEPKNAEYLSSLGLLVSPIIGIEEVAVDGKTEEAIISELWQGMGFKIYDGKVGISPQEKSPLENVHDVESLSELLSAFPDDISILVKNKIALGSDSINFALLDGKLRLFLSDFGNMTILENMSKEEINDMAEYYAFHSVAKLDNLMHVQQIRDLEQNGYTYESVKELARRIATQAINT